MIGSKAEVMFWLKSQKDGQYEIVPYCPGRTLTQNAYFHVLVREIAKAVRNLSDVEVKNRLIADYGVVDREMGVVIIDDSVPWDKSPYIHLRPTSATRVLDDGKLYRVCYVMRGTHTLNTADMAHLLDCTVAEAKQLGIETLPPQKLIAMRLREEKCESGGQ